MKIVFNDTETTGLEKEDKIVSSTFLVKHPSKVLLKEDYCNPKIKMKPEASMVTNILNSKLKNLPEFKNTLNYKALNFYSKNKYIYVAYNAYFDIKMLKKEGVTFKDSYIIDLYRVAKHIFKNYTEEELSPSYQLEIKNNKILNQFLNYPLIEQTQTPLKKYKLQYLRYLMEFDDTKEFKEILKEFKLKEISPHESKSDVIVMYYLFNILLNKFNISIKEMKKLSHTPVLEEEINFGNMIEHGKKYKDIIAEEYKNPKTGKNHSVVSYLMWNLENTDPMLDQEYSIKYYIANAIIEGGISYKPEMKKYLNYGIVFFFNDKEIKKAMEIIEEKSNFKNFKKDLKEKYLIQANKKIEDYENNKETKVTNNQYDNFLFMKRYLNVVRK